MKTGFGVVAPILILLVIAAIIAILYLLIYKKRVNRALAKGEGADGAGPEPSSVSRSALLIVLIIIMGIMLLRISDLKSTLWNINNTVSSQSSQIMNLQNQISQLSDMLKKQESIISDFSVEFGKLDADRHSAEVIFTATPKEVKDSTELKLTAGSHTVKLERKGTSSTFTGKLTADIFEEFPDQPKITLTTDGVSRTEELEYYELTELWLHYMPKIMVSGGGTAEFNKDTLKIDWDIQIDFISKAENAGFAREGIIMKTLIDGKVTDEKDISSEVNWDGDWGTYNTDLTGNITLEKGQSYKIIVTAKDSNGYTHETTVLDLVEDCSVPETMDEYHIYDASGKLLTD